MISLKKTYTIQTTVLPAIMNKRFWFVEKFVYNLLVILTLKELKHRVFDSTSNLLWAYGQNIWPYSWGYKAIKNLQQFRYKHKK